MLDKHKTKEQLLLELSEMRQRVNQIEKLHKEYFLTKDKLYESEKKHQTLIEKANDAIFLADAETGLIIDANKKAEKMIGEPLEKIIGMHQSQLHPKEELKRYKEIFRKHIEEGHTITEPLFVVNKSGDKIPVEISSNLLSFGGKKIIQGIFRDITERINAEKNLQESEAKYRLLFDNMLNGFAYHKVIYDEGNKSIDYIFLVVNNAFEVFTGLKKKDVIGKKVTEVIPGIKNAETDLISIYGEVALTGKSTAFELYFEPFNKWYLVSAYSYQKGYFAAIFDDISNQKKVENELRERIEELNFIR
jgi:PAS domain S-box-containing protein